MRLQRIREHVADAGERGGNVYLRSPRAYSLQERAYFQSLIGLTFDELEGFDQSPAFSCPGGAFVRMMSVGDP